jgi:hypothetical protein
VIGQVLLQALDQRVETPYCWVRFGIVSSVTGDYSSDMPLVEMDDAAGTLAPLYNYSAHTLAVGAKVAIVVTQDGDQIIWGKHPGTP